MSEFINKLKAIVGSTDNYEYYDLDEIEDNDISETNSNSENKTQNLSETQEVSESEKKTLDITEAKKTAKSIVAKILGEARYREKTTNELDEIRNKIDSGTEQELKYDLNLKGEDQKKGGWKDWGKNFSNTLRSFRFSLGEEAYEDKHILDAISPDIAEKLDNYIDNLLNTQNLQEREQLLLGGETEDFINELDNELASASEYGGLDRMQKLQLKKALDIVLNIKRVTKSTEKNTGTEKQIEYKIKKEILETNLEDYNSRLDELNQELTSEDYKKVAEDIKYDVRMKATKAAISIASRALTTVATTMTGGIGGGAAGVFLAGVEGFGKTWAVEGKSNAMMERDQKRLEEKNYTEILIDRDLSKIKELLTKEDVKFDYSDDIKSKKEKLEKIEDENEKNKAKEKFKLIDRIQSGDATIIPAEDLAKKRDEFKKDFIEKLREIGSPFELNKEEFKQAWRKECYEKKYVPLETAEQLYRKGDILVDGKEYVSSVENDNDSILSQSKRALNEFRKTHMEKIFKIGDQNITEGDYKKLSESQRQNVNIERISNNLWGDDSNSNEANTLKDNYNQLLELRGILKPRGGGDKKNSYKDVRLIRFLDEQIKEYEETGLFSDNLHEVNDQISDISYDVNNQSTEPESGKNKIQEKVKEYNEELWKYRIALSFKSVNVFSDGNINKSRVWNGAMGLVGNLGAYMGGVSLGQGFELSNVEDNLIQESVDIHGANLGISEHIKNKVEGVFIEDVKNIVDNSLNYNEEFWRESFKINGDGEWVSKFEKNIESRVVDFSKNIGENSFSIQDILKNKAANLINKGWLFTGASFVASPALDILKNKLFNKDKAKIESKKDNDNPIRENVQNEDQVELNPEEGNSNDGVSPIVEGEIGENVLEGNSEVNTEEGADSGEKINLKSETTPLVLETTTIVINPNEEYEFLFKGEKQGTIRKSERGINLISKDKNNSVPIDEANPFIYYQNVQIRFDNEKNELIMNATEDFEVKKVTPESSTLTESVPGSSDEDQTEITESSDETTNIDTNNPENKEVSEKESDNTIIIVDETQEEIKPIEKISNLDSDSIKNKEYRYNEYKDQIDISINLTYEYWKKNYDIPVNYTESFQVYQPRNEDKESFNIIHLKDGNFALFPSGKMINRNKISILKLFFDVNNLNTEDLDLNVIKPVIIRGGFLEGEPGNYELKKGASFNLVHKGSINEVYIEENNENKVEESNTSGEETISQQVKKDNVIDSNENSDLLVDDDWENWLEEDESNEITETETVDYDWKDWLEEEEYESVNSNNTKKLEEIATESVEANTGISPQGGGDNQESQDSVFEQEIDTLISDTENSIKNTSERQKSSVHEENNSKDLNDTEEQEEKNRKQEYREEDVSKIFENIRYLEEDYNKFLYKMKDYIDGITQNGNRFLYSLDDDSKYKFKLSINDLEDSFNEFKEINRYLINNEDKIFDYTKDELLSTNLSNEDLQYINNKIKDIIDTNGIMQDLFRVYYKFDEIYENKDIYIIDEFREQVYYFKEKIDEYKDKVKSIENVMRDISESDKLWDSEE